MDGEHKNGWIQTARVVAALVVLGALAALISSVSRPWGAEDSKDVVAAAAVSSPFMYSFNDQTVLNEAGSEAETTSPYWWLDSGGELWMKDGVGMTMQGDASNSNQWYTEYADTNAEDTDNGLHPQNIFRLVSRSKWQDVSQEASFKIVKDNFSKSPNHNASNGLLFFSRYQGSDTLYYSGIRVDGTAVIKKKYKGTYYTMAQKKVFPGTYDGDVADKNLLPHNEWISMRTDIKTNPDGTVALNLLVKKEKDTNWTLLLSTFDDGVAFDNTPAITDPGAEGIRTDFMDVQFKDYRLTAL